MTRVLVIGYGNPLRGDDGLGWHAIQQLAQTAWSDDVELRAPHQLTIELADPISKADYVIFIDACTGGEPGTVSICPLTPDGTAGSAATTHHVSPSLLLTIARELYGSSPDAVALGVNTTSFDFTEVLSEPIQTAMPAVIGHVNALVREKLHQG